jgi:hypothetical protein
MRVEQKEREGSGRVLRHNLEICPHLYDPGSCTTGLVDKSFRDAADSVLCLEPKDRQGSSRVLRHNLEVRSELDNLYSCTKGLAQKRFRDVVDHALCLEPKGRECNNLVLPHNLEVLLGLDNLGTYTKGFAENDVRVASDPELHLELTNVVEMDRSVVKSPQMHPDRMQKSAAARNSKVLKRLLQDDELLVESQSLSPDVEFV